MDELKFFYDTSRRFPAFEWEGDGVHMLGEWIIMDISTSPLVCLDALAMIDDVTNGRDPFVEWDSSNYEVSFSPGGFSVRNLWVPGAEGRYSVDEVRKSLEDYWALLREIPEGPHIVREFRPDLPAWEAALLRWEQKWGRSHPYRGRLF